MFDSVKLEKGMYHLANTSFAQALEAADPSEAYIGTPMASLDAYERQLKRFDIRISGPDCDCVEKFFTTTESAVLFPEFVRRAIKQGMEESILPELTAATGTVNGSCYKGFTIDESAGDYSVTASQGEELKTTTITEADTPVTLDKFGRVISASYEIVRRQRLDSFAIALRAIGRKLAAAIAAKALSQMADSVSPIGLVGSTLSYADLANLYGQFTDYDMTTVVASPKTVAAILAMEQMADRVADEKGTVYLPFGAKLIKDASLDDATMIGLSKDYALECITGSDVLLETDQLIHCQLDRIVVSIRVGFLPLMNGAAAVINWN